MVVRSPRNGIVAALLFATLLSNAPYSVGTNAQMGANCARELDRYDREIQAFGRDVKKQNLDFVADDAVGHSLTDMKDLAKGQPDQIALRKLVDLKEKTANLAKELMTFEEVTAAMWTCLKSGPPHCLMDLAALQRADYQRWLKSLAEENLSGALERVNKARSLVQEYGAKLTSMAEGSMKRGLENCIDETQKAVDSHRAPVNTTSPRPARGGEAAAAPPAEKSGISGGTKVLIGLGGVAITAAVFKDDLQGLLAGGDGSSCSGTPPDVSACYAGNGNAPGCQPALVALDAYCLSCGKTRGRNADATVCVAK